MKKGILAVLIVLLLVPFSAQADVRQYGISLGSSQSGNTTAAKTGTSTFAVTDGFGVVKSGVSEIAGMLDTGGLCAIQITGATVAQAYSALKNYSGTTFCVYAQGTYTDNWTNAEKLPVYMNEVLSGSTIEPRTFYAPPGAKMRLVFGSTGVTPFDGITAVLFTNIGNNWLPPSPLLIDTLTFTMPASGTGVSSFAGTDSDGKSFPQGTRCVILENTSQSGVTVMHNQTATTITDTGIDKTIAGADTYVYVGSLEDLKKIRLKSYGATLRAYCYTAKPY